MQGLRSIKRLSIHPSKYKGPLCTQYVQTIQLEEGYNLTFTNISVDLSLLPKKV